MHIVKRILVFFTIFFVDKLCIFKMQRPKTIKIFYNTYRGSSFELDLYRPLLEKLKSNTGKSIEFYMPTSYASVAEALIGGFVIVAVLGPYGYITAKEDPSIQCLQLTQKERLHAKRGSWISIEC